MHGTPRPRSYSRAHQRARAFRRDQDHVDVVARFDLLEVHVEAMREQQRGAGLDVRLDRFLVQLGLHHVGREHGDQIGTDHRIGRFDHVEAIVHSLLQVGPPGRRPTTTSRPESLRLRAWARPWLP